MHFTVVMVRVIASVTLFVRKMVLFFFFPGELNKCDRNRCRSTGYILFICVCVCTWVFACVCRSRYQRGNTKATSRRARRAAALRLNQTTRTHLAVKVSRAVPFSAHSHQHLNCKCPVFFSSLPNINSRVALLSKLTSNTLSSQDTKANTTTD